MINETLYRKYRPQKFAEVLGQEHVVNTLEQSIKKGSIAHAYLFAGTRGTGKTSVARILAREVGCKGSDLYEIDAASNTGVDEIRSIIESLHSMPYESTHKVYILDEAHMLSKSAWNALLKTLEEPPKHCIFILATTEIEKVPETVLSRCQVFNFKKPSAKILSDTIESIAKSEGFKVERSASELIAFLSEGSFRDAESILQKIISSSSDKTVSVSEVEAVTGAPKGKIINSLIEGLEEGKSDSSFAAVSAAAESNIDMKIFLRLILEKLRFVLLLRFAPDLKEEIRSSLPEEDFKILSSIAGKKSSRINSKVLDEFLRAYEEINYAAIDRLPIELAIVRIFESTK